MNVKKISESLSELSMLKYFPADEHAQTAILRLVCAMVGDQGKVSAEEQVSWLVRRMISLYNDWPGPKEMRAVFCSRFKPADGIEALPDMEKWPEGLPADTTLPPLLPAPSFRQIERGGDVTDDPELAASFERLMVKTALPNSALSHRERRREAQFNKLLEAVTTAPNDRKDLPDPNNRITQADIDAAVRERKRANAALRAGE